jgi:hypothetical protein
MNSTSTAKRRFRSGREVVSVVLSGIGMTISRKITILVGLIMTVSALSGCGISSAGWTAGPISISDYNPPFDYEPPATGLPIGSLICIISKPVDYTQAEWDDKLWIYGIIWREGKEINEYEWDGPVWEIDSRPVEESRYRIDQTWPEFYVRFLFDAEEYGSGRHEITLRAWDNRTGISQEIEDSIIIDVE